MCSQLTRYWAINVVIHKVTEIFDDSHDLVAVGSAYRNLALLLPTGQKMRAEISCCAHLSVVFLYSSQ